MYYFQATADHEVTETTKSKEASEEDRHDAAHGYVGRSLNGIHDQAHAQHMQCHGATPDASVTSL